MRGRIDGVAALPFSLQHLLEAAEVGLAQLVGKCSLPAVIQEL
jgi:hypothetical protein